MVRAQWVLAAVAWVGLALTLGVPLTEALTGAEAPLRVGGEALFWAVYAAGALATFVPRPAGLVALRLGGLWVVGAGVALAVWGDVPTLWRVVAPVSAAAAALVQFLPGVGDRLGDGASYPGERRFLLRWPRYAAPGIAVAVIVPTACAQLAVLALATGGTGRWVAAAGAAVLAWPAVFFCRRLGLLGGRWVIFMPRAVVAHDPSLLAQPLSIPRNRITGCGLGRTPDGLLDTRLGAPGEWLAVVTEEPFEPPEPRIPELADRVPALVHGFAAAPTLLAACLAEASARGIRVGGGGS